MKIYNISIVVVALVWSVAFMMFIGHVEQNSRVSKTSEAASFKHLQADTTDTNLNRNTNQN